jgi:hypothetical protein
MFSVATTGDMALPPLRHAVVPSLADRQAMPELLTPAKRGPGRPRGSGPHQLAQAQELSTMTVKRKPGRPLGTGHRQLAHAHASVLATDGQEHQSGVPGGNSSDVTSDRHEPNMGQGHSNHSPSSPMVNDDVESDTNTLPALMQGVQQGANSDTLRSAQQSSIQDTPDTTFTSLAHVIPEEDSQRDVAAPDGDEQDGYFGLMGDGIGVEGPVSEDLNLDGDPGHKLTDAIHQTEKSDPKSPYPSWLMTTFREYVEASNKRDGKLPPLYANHGSFWFPTKSRFFVLCQNHPTPQDLFTPRFFLWDPEPLVFGGIPCPNCGLQLLRHGHIALPRRCVDLYDNFWIIGYRYRCGSCQHPTSKKSTLTFNSWDNRILLKIPPHLAAEFPARLSSRSGISLATFGFMRSCFQNGMGAKQFSDALRVQHLRHYDELHLQYLQSIAMGKKMDSWLRKSYDPFLKFDDTSVNGFHGFVPSAQWLQDIYDHFIEEHRHELEQHTAMRSGEICSIDHSFKV